MKLFFEKAFPYIIGAICGALSWGSDLQLPTSDNLLGSTLGVAGVLVGFMSTSKAILMSMSSPIIEQLKKSKYMTELVSYMGEAIWVNLSFCAVSIVGYFVDHQSHIYTMAWIAFATTSALAFVRITHIMLRIVRFA